MGNCADVADGFANDPLHAHDELARLVAREARYAPPRRRIPCRRTPRVPPVAVKTAVIAVVCVLVVVSCGLPTTVAENGARHLGARIGGNSENEKDDRKARRELKLEQIKREIQQLEKI